jgi:signal transduction histidine kinase
LLGALSSIKDDAGRRLVELEDRYGDRTGLRRRFDDSIQAQQQFHTKQLNSSYRKVSEAVESLQQQVKSLIAENRQKAKVALEGVNADFSATSFTGRSSQELYDIKKDLELKIEVTSTDIINRVETLTEQLNTARVGRDENDVASNVLVAALESEYEHLKEQHERNLEMVQLGMALSVINHEFNGNVLSIRRGLNEMQPFAKRSENFKLIYDRVRTGFDHLDGYLRTFTPLTRRLSRRRVAITGKAVSEFVVNVFGERTEAAKIKFVFTSSFLRQEIVSFTSTIYPAFVNLIDNSIHWLEKSSGDRVITLDASSTGFIVRDSGLGIPTIDQDNVFEFGFSRRVGGQGMGLYVSRETLAKDGFKLELKEYQPDCGAVFLIEPEGTSEGVK